MQQSHSQVLLEYYKDQDWIDKSAIVLSRPPEIQQIVYLKEKMQVDELTICYPEPPIYAEEMDWVNYLNVNVFTPLWSNTQKQEQNFRVGISISDYGEIDFNQLHIHPDELKRLSQELARHLLVNKNILIYGGDLRANGFTEFILEEASILKNRLPKKSFSVENHLAWPLHLLPESLDYQADYHEVLNQINYALPDEFSEEVDSSSWLEVKTSQDRYIFSKCLRAMRMESIKGSDIRIFAGGKIQNYKGFMPGVLEEFYIAAKLSKPIFLIGGFGGVVKEICNSIVLNRVSEVLTQEWQEENDSDYKDFMAYLYGKSYNFNYDELHQIIQSVTIESLANKSGLNVDEYYRLINSQFIDEIIYLILKGLNNLCKN
ncbi:hypothetical protein F895_00211 [Acinetobacter sp. CIP 64.2]|uniref:hypothetical protein n=1 Tax=Acinetobacter sp. CIP 64.2 TaxID=1217694 RepID=UPI00028969F0|nr:hypothetical protein [Acinetobacter sp. CIP 64.2]ENX18142.1 hypothetical protein F895_00211 [Acinetobacter sp. CIP 64.2]